MDEIKKVFFYSQCLSVMITKLREIKLKSSFFVVLDR